MAITITELKTEFTAELKSLQAGVLKMKTLLREAGTAQTGLATTTTTASKSMGGFQSAVQALMGKVGLGGLTAIISPTTLGIAGIVTAALAAAKALTSMFMASVKAFQQVIVLAQRFGISARWLLEMRMAAETSETSLEGIVSAVKFLSRNLFGVEEGSDKAVAAFQKLGFNIDELKKLSPENLFMKVGKAIGAIQNPTERTGIAIALMGRNANEMIPLLTSNMEAAKEMSLQLMGVMERGPKAADEFSDAMLRNKLAVHALKDGIVLALLPATTKLAKWTTDYIAMMKRLNQFYRDLITKGPKEALRILGESIDKWNAATEAVDNNIAAQRKLLASQKEIADKAEEKEVADKKATDALAQYTTAYEKWLATIKDSYKTALSAVETLKEKIKDATAPLLEQTRKIYDLYKQWAGVNQEAILYEKLQKAQAVWQASRPGAGRIAAGREVKGIEDELRRLQAAKAKPAKEIGDIEYLQEWLRLVREQQKIEPGNLTLLKQEEEIQAQISTLLAKLPEQTRKELELRWAIQEATAEWTKQRDEIQKWQGELSDAFKSLKDLATGQGREAIKIIAAEIADETDKSFAGAINKLHERLLKGFSLTERQSPSVLDVVRSGLSRLSDAFASFMPPLNMYRGGIPALAMGGGFGGTANTSNVSQNFGGVNINTSQPIDVNMIRKRVIPALQRELKRRPWLKGQ